MQRDVLAASSLGYKSAQELKGAADAKATAIYARAYGKDPEFYQFTRSLETMRSSLDEKAWLILTTDSELLQYLKSSGR
jgi:membrane protease subunit HflC